MSRLALPTWALLTWAMARWPLPTRPLPRWPLLLAAIAVGGAGLSPVRVSAQAIGDDADPVVNLSQTDGRSANPFLLADPTGAVHLFWAEAVGGSDLTNIIMYARWTSGGWSVPTDILVAPPETGVALPHAAIDAAGVIHLIWIGGFPYTVYYSAAHASQAASPTAWTAPAALARDVTGTQYGIHIAYTPPETLHVLYASVMAGDNPSGPRSVDYIRSDDGGARWGEPDELWLTLDPERGASATRLLVAAPGRMYASWSEWDASGNGQAVYVARSTDDGTTWSEPLALAELAEGDYEHDWLQLAVPDPAFPDELLAIWEGGQQAFRQMRRSLDGGATWSDREDIFPLLVGENGFMHFAYDADGRLHGFLTQRGRSETGREALQQGLWHVFWDGERWSEPEIVGGRNPNHDPVIALSLGRTLVAAFFTSGGGDLSYEILTLVGRLANVAAAPPATLAPDLATLPPPRRPDTGAREATTTPTTTPGPAGGERNAPQSLAPARWSWLPALLGTASALVIVVAAIAATRHAGR